MRNNNFKRGEPSFQRKKQPQRAGKGRQEGKEASREGAAVGQRQVQSRIEYINFKQDAELNINRLDLIFQKQPREIQEKLMKLLISYNAILQYNKDTDLFEVDLLLPFLNEDEKKNFVRQFLEIRTGKKREASQDRPAQPAAIDDHREPNSHSNSNSFNQSKEIRKFSFNNNIKFASEFEEEVQREEENRLNQSHQSSQRSEEDHRSSMLQNNQHEHNPRDNSHSTSSNALASLQNKGLNLMQIEESISQRLKNAINIINRRKGREERNKENENSKSILINDEDVRKEDSIIEKLAESNQFNESQRYSEDKSSFYIKEDVGETEEPSEERLFARNHIEEPNLNAHQHSEKFAEVIMEQTEEEDYEPLFAGKQKGRPSDKVTSFEDYTRKYATLKQATNPAKPKNSKNRTNQRDRPENQVSVPRNYFSSKDKQRHKNSSSSFEAQQPEKAAERQLAKQQAGSKQRVRSRQSSSHSRSISTKKESPSKEALEIKQHLSDFFSQHQQHLQSLYSEIRSKITGQPKPASSQKARQPEREQSATASQEDFYILVLDDLEQEDSQGSSGGEFPHSRQFRSEMIREYKREILRTSKNLSSEELIRYFKYLHANAKKLYLKYLTSRRGQR